MGAVVELGSILLAAFALRFLFLTTASTDDMVHLWNVQLRRRHGDMSSHEPLDSLLEGKRGYPTLAHWFTSFFPRSGWRIAGKLLNISWDLCLVALTYFAAAHACGGASGAAAVAGLLVATSPMLLPVTSRMKSMGGRALGNLMCFSGLIGVWMAMQGQAAAGLFIATVSGLGIILSSKFGLQYWLLSLPLLTLYGMSLMPLAALGLTFAAAFVVPGLGFRDVLSFEWAHTRAYMVQWHKGTTAAERNRLGDLLHLPRMFKSNRDIFLGIIFRRSSILIALMGFPLVWPLIYVFVHGGGATSATYEFCIQVVSASLTVFALISFRPLSFLGQAERYLEYAVPFAAVAAAIAWSQDMVSDQGIMLLVALQVAVTVANYSYSMLNRVKQSVQMPSPLPVAEFLNTLSKRRILTVPLKLAFTLSMDVDEERGHRFYYRAINQPGTGMAYKRQDCVWFETPRPDLEYFATSYGVDTVVISKRFLSDAVSFVDYDFTRHHILYEDDAHVVLDLLSKPFNRQGGIAAGDEAEDARVDGDQTRNNEH